MGQAVAQGTRAARDLRGRLGLAATAPADLDWIARQLGVVVVVLPLTDGLSGIHLAHSSRRSFIAINSRDIFTRQNFTLAHEIAHHLLDSADTIAEAINVKDASPKEMRANAFAAELLLPEKAVQEWLNAPHFRLEPNEVARLALAYQTSYQATLFRLKTFNALDDVADLYAAKDQIDPTLRQLLNRPGAGRDKLSAEFVRMADEALRRNVISRRRHAEIVDPPIDGDDF